MPDTPRDLNRPDPDALLAEVKQNEARRRRGTLKIFFGMSAGVGKTYAMLEEARKRAAEGVDILVGYAEPHIRPETEAILVALDILPYRLVEYRGATLKEFDVDAAIARKPAICCVDELAHTNAPGMRHRKRWQDVAELLDAGISVYATLNVQHLESVNDLVERITGVRVRETLPDAIFEAADAVELVDIAPEELLERFREGRIYKPEQAERAAKHFFTKGNLMALRELALRKTADRVDEQMLQYRRDERQSQIVPATEKVLVCVGPSPLSARLVRSARRLASAMRAKLIAVSVEPAGATLRSAADREQTEANLRIAEELGAQIVTLTGRQVAAEVLAYATSHNVTKIVIGKSARSRWKEIVFGSVVDELIRDSGEIDIYVIRGDGEASTRTASGHVEQTPVKPDWFGYSIAVAIVVITTVLCWPLLHRFRTENENILMIYLLGVLWVSTRHSRGAALLTSVLSVLAFDFIFVEPYYQFAIQQRQYVVTFVVMFLTALVISALTYRVREQTESARGRERRTAAVLQLSRDLSIARTAAQVATAAARHVSDALGGRAAVLLPDSEKAMRLAADSSGESAVLDERELGVVQWASDHAEPAGRGTGTLPASAGQYVPMTDGSTPVGVLAIYPEPPKEDWSIEQRDLAHAMAMQAAVALGRVSLGEEARGAWERVESESLRNTLLSGVSHELRTPLAGITGAATALADVNDQLSPAERKEMLDTLVGEAERMERLINNLLDMSRLEAGGVSLKRDWTPIEEVIGATLRHLEHRLGNRAVKTQIARGLPLAWIDGSAVEQVLANLIDNAIEYTPAGREIIVKADASIDRVSIEVADHGPGVVEETRRRLFDKFFRGQPTAGSSRRGVGLGLAICRALVEAHGGTIEAFNRAEGGASFRFTLPTGGAAPAIDSTG